MTLIASAALAAPSTAQDPYESKSYPAGVVKKLSVETDSGPITLRQTLSGPTLVDVSPAKPGDDCRVTQDLRGGALKLVARAGNKSMGLGKTCSAGFTVTASAESIDAKSGSGSIGFDSGARKIDARTGSGAINVGTVSSKAELSLRSGSGLIAGDNASAARIDAETGSGDVRLRGLIGTVKARSGSGALALDWAAAPASGAIDANTGSGNLFAAFPKGTKLKTNLRSAAGSVKSDFDDKDAAVTLTFKSGSGDATVTRKP